MSNLYVITKPLVFSEYETIDPSLYLQTYNNKLLTIAKVFNRHGKLITENEFYYKTIDIWKKHKFIEEYTNPKEAYGFQYNFNFMKDSGLHGLKYRGWDDEQLTHTNKYVNKLKEESKNYHGCHAVIIAYPHDIYISPVYEDKHMLTRKVYKYIQTNQDYWIIEAPEPLLKRINLLFDADDTNISYKNIEKIIKKLKPYGLTVINKNYKK